MDVFGFTIPLWAMFLGVIVFVVVAWKFIKFALKLLIVILIFFGILIGFDILGIFDILKNILTVFL